VGACAGLGARAESSTATAQSSRGFPALDSARLMADLTRLSHDSMAGRATGTPENAKARAWLIAEMQRHGLQPVNGSFEHPFSMPRRGRPDSVKGANVLATIPGTGSTDAVIVISAHYDHVGTRNGEIFNGADDNASGTAALLQLIAHFKAKPPKHTLLVAFFDAEEMGLLGARAMVANPPIPLTRIAANVNMDMVSRSDSARLWAAGATPWPQLRPLLEQLAADAPLTLKLGFDSGTGRDNWMQLSDQGAFHSAGIPAVLFSVEDHADYHKSTDDVERIQPGFYYNATRTIAEFVTRLDAALPLAPR
jgi:Zn-dependent M28 family amino/carboxypeptidase